MNTTTYLNTPVKSCYTCVHRKADELGERFDFCRRFQGYCEINLRRCELREWRPVPPKPVRRSLRQWLCDLFIA